MTQLGLDVVDECVWETFRRGESQKSVIDLVFKSKEVKWINMECEWLQTDHAYISGTIKIQQRLPPLKVRKTLNELRLEACFTEIGDMPPEDQAMWYHSLEGNTAYAKLLGLVNMFQKESRISGRSKRWWDKDLKTQLTQVRQLGREGQGALARNAHPARCKCWREEKTKMRRLVRKKKRACGEKFLEENGRQSLWDVIRMAKSTWGTKERMKMLKDKDGIDIQEKESGDAMEKEHFL